MNEKEWQPVIDRLENYCRERNYAGHCKFDALNSPLLERSFGFSAPTRLVVTQAVNRVPLPLRQVLGVRKLRNPKGIANFVKGYCALQKQKARPDRDRLIRELSDWLLKNDSVSKGAYRGTGKSWGYQFPWQSPGFYAPRYAPNCIVTTFCAEALLAAYRATEESRYLDGALAARDFILTDLPVLEERGESKCIGYVPTGPRWAVININAVVAGFLAKLAKQTNDSALLREAGRLVNWTVAARQPNHSWNYTAPRSQSGIGPDNYHTGGILDGILDYMSASGDFSHEEVYRQGLEFYEKNLFTSDFAPKWRVHRSYPQDVHGAAQGILTFVKAAKRTPRHLETAGRIAHWAIGHLWDADDGRFHYQKFRAFTWKLDLMRWNNSWMFWALSELGASASGRDA